MVSTPPGASGTSAPRPVEAPSDGPLAGNNVNSLVPFGGQSSAVCHSSRPSVKYVTGADGNDVSAPFRYRSKNRQARS